MIFSEDFIERLGDNVKDYEPYKNDNNIRLRLKYEFVPEELKEETDKCFSISSTQFCTKKVKGT